MNCIVTYTNGRPAKEYDSVQKAASALLAEYPGGVIYDAGGFDHGTDDADAAYDVRDGRIALVWSDEDASVEDDGSHAVAEIQEDKEDAPKLDRSDVFVDLCQGENRSGHAFGFVGVTSTSDYQGWFFDYPSEQPVIENEAELESVLDSLNLDSETACSDDPAIPADWARGALESRLRERWGL